MQIKEAQRWNPMLKYIPLVVAVVSVPASAQYGDPFVDAMIADGDRARIKEQNDRILEQQNAILEAQRRAQYQTQTQKDYYAEYTSALSILDAIAAGQCQYARNVASFHPLKTQSAVRALCNRPRPRK